MVKKSNSKKTKRNKTNIITNKLDDKVLQNLIDLQKVHTNLAEKFDKLAEQISNLLALFEMSARSLAKQPHFQSTEKDKEFLEKIDKLLDQNKTLARGLSLMEEKMRERLYGPTSRNLRSNSQMPGL
jgi:lipid II:glycine glycyltransferase (peptidoglycan interpeptide bridge formation enzyme)